MPAFLIKKLKKQYPGNNHAIYGTLNKLGAMKGSRETAKGALMQAKHDRDHGVTRKPSGMVSLKSIMKRAAGLTL